MSPGSTGRPPTDGQSASRQSVRRTVLLALFFVPWTLLFAPGGTTLVFPWGLVNPETTHVTTLSDYLLVYTAGLPERLLAWPVSVCCYLAALISAFSGRYEDRRVTGGLLVLAGGAHAVFALGFSTPGVGPSGLVVPLGPVLLWATAWWFHWPDLLGAISREP